MALGCRYEDSFVPARDNPAICAVAKMLVPVVQRQEGLQVKPSANCITTLRRLRGVPTVIIPNHTDRLDPLALFTLAKQSGENFFYVAARETFDEDGGLRGWLFQNIGAYSVTRGTQDLAYLHATIDLVKEHRRKLVMFAEGEVNGRDDDMLPPKTHSIGCLFMAQRALITDGNADQSVQILPLSIFYQVNGDVRALLDQSVSQLEAGLSISAHAGSLEQRLDAICRIILEVLEQYFGCSDGHGLSFAERVDRLARHFSSVIAALTGEEIFDDVDPSTMLHASAAKLRFPRWTSPIFKSQYGGRMLEQVSRRSQTFAEDYGRIARLIVMSNLLQGSQTEGMLWRLVDCLQLEVFGRPIPKGTRTAFLEAAEPIALTDYWSGYQNNRDETLDRVADVVRERIVARLRDLRSQAQGKRVFATH